mmetsp:Transcript_13540/g.33229  ORF Transcript_13540/g.33229 Transcript_13540/m.33229 type:complete len:216 (-) Transcript_13540:259-906(-)
MVGGLIQQQDVRLHERDGGEHDARLLPARQLADGCEVVLPRQTKLAQLGAHALGLEPRLRELAHQVLHRVLVKGQRVHKVLRVAPDAQLVRAARLAGGGHQVARQQVHERRLAGAVRAHDGDARPHVHADVDVLQPKVVTTRVLEVDVDDLDEGRGQLGGLGEVELHRVVAPLLRLVGAQRGRPRVVGRAAVLLGLRLGRVVAHLVRVLLGVLAA